MNTNTRSLNEINIYFQSVHLLWITSYRSKNTVYLSVYQYLYIYIHQIALINVIWIHNCRLRVCIIKIRGNFEYKHTMTSFNFCLGNKKRTSGSLNVKLVNVFFITTALCKAARVRIIIPRLVVVVAFFFYSFWRT